MSFALLTDLYQLTMVHGYWRSGIANTESVFHLSFRKLPFMGGYAIACGLHSCVAYLRDLRFSNEDLEYLKSLPGGGKPPLFGKDFLRWLKDFRFNCDVDAIPEGTAVFPHEPLLRVRGALAQAQLVETALLNFVNFETLIATKAARVCLAAQGDRVIEFGLRRAQGPDGGISASRAAFVGGCVATSNVLAGQKFGIPVAGTHAHSWVTSFATELQAFRAYAEAMPHNCIFLVDTYDSLQGVRNAVTVGRELRKKGFELLGVRLDSGDLAWLSTRARAILDEGGFPRAWVVASNDLDEHIIESLKQQRARIDTWGVGTKLVTAYDQPALGGVYKLSALRDRKGSWNYKVKLSEQTAKVTIPGILQVRRFSGDSEFTGDAIYNTESRLPARVTIVDPADAARRKRFPGAAKYLDLLVPVMRSGKLVHDLPPLHKVRETTQTELQKLHAGITRLVHPHIYPAGLELGLHALRARMLRKIRANLRDQDSTVEARCRALRVHPGA